MCISDTHNHTVKLPRGDVLIHAGDLTNQGSYSEVGDSLLLRLRRLPAGFERMNASHLFVPSCSYRFACRADGIARHIQLSKAVRWLEKADFEAKIVVAGTCPRETPAGIMAQVLTIATSRKS